MPVSMKYTRNISRHMYLLRQEIIQASEQQNYAKSCVCSVGIRMRMSHFHVTIDILSLTRYPKVTRQMNHAISITQHEQQVRTYIRKPPSQTGFLYGNVVVIFTCEMFALDVNLF